MRAGLVLRVLERGLVEGDLAVVDLLADARRLTKLFHEKFLTAAESRLELSEFEAAINFIEEKMSYLDKKISLAGGVAAAKAKVPKAYKRWKIGPRLLYVAQSLKVEKQNQLLEAERRECKSLRDEQTLSL